MPTLQDVEGWKGRTVVDPDGDKVGTLEEFYLDRQSGDPTWAAIRTGLFGTHTSLAPLDGAAVSGNDVQLGYSKSAVKDAPRPEVEGELTRDEERRLFDHYGAAKAAAQPEPTPEPEPERHAGPRDGLPRSRAPARRRRDPAGHARAARAGARARGPRAGAGARARAGPHGSPRTRARAGARARPHLRLSPRANGARARAHLRRA